MEKKNKKETTSEQDTKELIYILSLIIVLINMPIIFTLSMFLPFIIGILAMVIYSGLFIYLLLKLYQ